MKKKIKASKSLLSNEQVCYVCGCTGVHRHHIYYGTANRKISEKYGCWVWLCPDHHNMSDAGVHFDKRLDLALKAECQERWEKEYGTREDFRRIFGKNFL